MKRLLIIACCLTVLAGLTLCKKPKKQNNATCKTCTTTVVSQTGDSSSLFYYLPTAFTPNGDLINDRFYLYFHGLDTNASTLTVWYLNGTEVFTGRITQHWDGKDLNGKLCAAGQYPVYLQLKTLAGATVNTCACVTILTYTGGCIKTNGITYYFPDQASPVFGTGFVFTTNEQLCP